MSLQFVGHRNLAFYLKVTAPSLIYKVQWSEKEWCEEQTKEIFEQRLQPKS